MNSSSLAGRVLSSSCCIYTICALLLCLGQLAFSDESMLLSPLSFLLLFPFAVCFAGANLLYSLQKLSSGVRLLLHFLVLSVGVVFFVFLPAGIFATGRSALVMVCAYLLLYVIAMLLFSLIRSALYRSGLMHKQ